MKKFYSIFFATLFFAATGFAQSLIDPAAGGFEAGTDFVSNGWHAVNSSTNKWEVGTATRYAGIRGAYISDDGGANNSFDNTSPHISHIYKDVTIPGFVPVANLQWYLRGRANDAFGVNHLEVYVDPSLGTPVADVLPTGGSVVQIYNQAFSNPSSPVYLVHSFNLAGFAATGTVTVRIIFTWINDVSAGANPPAAIDDVTLCATPTAFNVTGGGGYCIGGTGVHIGLDGSELGVSYQLLRGATPIGLPLPGDGNALDFGLLTVAGTYTIQAISDAPCTDVANMTGNAVVTINPLPTFNVTSPVAITCVTNPLGATIGEPAESGAAYAWSPATDLSSPSISNPVATPAANTNYTVTKTITATGCSNTASVSVTVDKTIPSVSAGSPFTKTCTLNTGGATIGEATQAGNTYSWSPATGLSSPSVSNPNANPTATETYTVIKTTTANGCTNSASVIVTVDNTLPVVSISGASTLCIGGTTSLSPASGGTWVSSNTAVATVTNAGTVTAVSNGSATFTFTQASNGCSNTTAAVTVNPTPDVAPKTDLVFCKGAPTGTISFTGSVGGTAYSWTNNNTAIGLAAGGTGDIASFIAANTGTAPITATITVTPSYFNGTTCFGNPTSFTITVNPTIAITNNTNVDQVVCNGSPTASVSFVTNASGAGTVTYSWTNDNTSIGLAATSTNSNLPSFTAINTGTAPVTATITVTPTITNGSVSCAGTPKTFTITVNPTPTVAAIADQAICKNASTTAVTFVGTVPGTTYNWTNSNTAIGFASANGTSNSIPAFSGINNGTTPVSATFEVTPLYFNTINCVGTPVSYIITVNPTPTVNAVSNQTVCNNSPTAAVTFTGTASPTYNWTNNNTSINLAASGTGNIASFTAVNTGTTATAAVINITPTANGCPGSPTSFTINVNPTPTVNAVADQAVCNGAPTTLITFSGAVTPVTYNWVNNTPSINLAATGTNNIASFTAVNNGAANVVATVTVTPTAATCPGSPTNFNITVYPTPTVNNPGNQTVCTGTSTTAVNFTGNGTTYDWTNDNPSIGIGASGSGNIGAFTATNNTSSPITATISVTPKANGCNGAVMQFTITVNPRPAITGPILDSVCSYSTFSFTPVDGTNGVVPSTTTYTWGIPTQQAPLTGGAAGSGATSVTGVLTNSDSLFSNTVNMGAPHDATYNVTPAYTNNLVTCTGAPFQLVVTVNPNPPKGDASFFQNCTSNLQTICDGTLLGGGGQDDADVQFAPGCVRPTTSRLDNQGFDWDWEFSNSNLPYDFQPSPGVTTVFYQHVFPPRPSVYSTLGDHYIRFSMTRNNCTTYSDTIIMRVTSTITMEAGGPYVNCVNPGPITLSGASIGGTAATTPTARWEIFQGGGTLSNNNYTTSPQTVSYTTAPGFTGIAKLVLRSNDPDSISPGNKGTCNPVIDTAYIIIPTTGTLPLCISPANWTLTGNGSLDQANAACATLTLVGGNSGSGSASNTDYTICSGAGNFSFDWAFTAPAAEGATPVWSDQTVNSGAGAANPNNYLVAIRPNNLADGDIIVVTLHARDNIGSITSPAGYTLIRRESSGSNGSDNRGTVLSYWKVARAPFTGGILDSFRASSMGTNDTWFAVAARVAGADTTNPVDVVSGTNNGTSSATTLTIPSITTTGPNRLLIAAHSIIDDDHTLPLTKPGSMAILTEGNSSLGDDITYGVYSESRPTAGATGTRAFQWANSDAYAAQMFALKPAFVLDDSAMVIVNGVQTILTGSNGSSGSFTKAVNSNDVIGLRVKTRTNQGGAGRLTFYNVNIPNDAPVATGSLNVTAAIPNPPDPTIYFVAPTVTDNCGNKVRLVTGFPQDGATVNSGCNNTKTRTWIYQDSCGVQSTAFTQTLTWTTDNSKPVFDVVPPAQTFCISSGPTFTIPQPSASDNCGGAVTISYAITGATTRSGTGSDASGAFAVGTSTITWTAADANGNTETAITTVTVKPVPTATLSLAGAAAVCAGGSSTLSVALTGTGPWIIKYSANGVAAAPITINTSPFTFSTGALAASTSFLLTEVNYDVLPSCPGTVSGNVSVSVNAAPTATLTGTTAICNGFSTNLTVGVTGVGPWTVTYTANGASPTTVTFSDNPHIITVNPVVNTTYAITAISDANCSGTSFGSSAVVTVSPVPVVTISSTFATVCNGGSSTLTASGATTYSWSGAGLSATTGASVVATPTVTTVYTVTGTALGCNSNPATTTVTVGTPPVTTGATICQGNTGTLTATGTCAGGGQTSTAATNAGRGVDTTGIGTIIWPTPNNITAPLGSPYSTVTFTGGTGPIATHYLRASNYGFNIPNGATIDGITVVINRRVNTSTLNLRDNVVRLVDANGNVVGENKALSAIWTTSFLAATYPTAALPDPKWGITTWTAADINDPDFGVVLSVSNQTAASRTLDVDYIQITVTYTVNGTMNWYTASSGGTFLGSGSPFNPVGVSGSGLPNTNTPGTTTFYAECFATPGCRSAADFIINSPAVGGTLNTPSVCAGGPGTLTLTGYAPGIIVQWESSTNAGSTWNIISNTTNTQNYTASGTQTLYRALIEGGACGDAYSTTATIGIHNLWTGGTSIDWNTASNWSDGQVPNLSCPNVVIQSGTPFQPTLGSGIATINNLIINPLATLTVAGAKLQLAGTITNNGTFNALNGTLEFNGNSGAQNISGAWFVNHTVNSLMVSNSAGINVTGAATDSLKIIDSLSFGNVNNSTVNTGDHIVLISAAASTARVSDVTNGGVNTGNHFNGKVTVQRFYPGNRSWRLVTAPLSNTGNIYDSWQNSGVYDVGKGMFVTGPNPTAANGLDNSIQNNYSMKGWDMAAQNYANVGDSKATLLSGVTASAANKAFFTFVRGDRSRTPDNTIIPNTNNTTLSSNGNLQTGTQTFPASAVANGLAMIGNPYASPVDFGKLSLTNLANRFTAWDPQLNDVGGFVVIDGVTGGSTPLSLGGQNRIIQSSQAFFVQTAANGPASVTFNEQHKSKTVSFGMFRPLPNAADKKLYVNLYKFRPDNTSYLADGTMTEFDDSYNADYTIDDAPKFINLNETFGLLRNNKWLAIEQRPTIKETDTLFFKLTKTTARKYQLRLKADNLEQDNLAGFVEDSYLNKLIPMYMKGITTVDFEISSDAASAAQTRFRVIFNPSVTYTDLNASVVKNDIAVNWNISSEYNIREYEILRSTDGSNFSKVGTVKATGNDHNAVAYQWLDIAPATGYYYYRIRSISNNEVTGHSNIVKIKLNRTSPGMYVFPNPVTNGVIQLQMNNMSGGVYAVRLINNLGQELFSKRISHGRGTATETIRPNRKIITGNYHLEVLAPDKKKTIININVQ